MNSDIFQTTELLSRDARYRLRKRWAELAEQRWDSLLENGIDSFLSMILDYYTSRGQDPRCTLRCNWVPVQLILLWSDAALQYSPFEFFSVMKNHVWLDFDFHRRGGLSVKLRATPKPQTKEFKSGLSAPLTLQGA